MLYFLCKFKTPVIRYNNFLLLRVYRAIRFYAFGLAKGNKAALFKNCNGYIKLSESEFTWKHGETYQVEVETCGDLIRCSINDKELIIFADNYEPYMNGMAGLSV